MAPSRRWRNIPASESTAARYVIDSTPRHLLCAATCCAALLCSGAFAQQGESAASGRGPPSVGDEVIVIGKSPGQLRAEMERAEEAVYDRFNALNSDHQFDIHCRREAPLRSQISRRVCQPNFWRDAEARAGQETLRSIQGGGAMDPAIFFVGGNLKRELLRQEMKRVAAQDEQFQKTLVGFVKLKEALDGAVRSPSRTASVEKSAGQEPLPFGAALAVDVHIGRRPWQHPLTHRTFTFAQVHGEIGRLEVECGERTEQPQYDDGAEWTLPNDWKSCGLHVEAARGTTFTLYEFE